MKTKLKIRRDDSVVVIAGKNKGKVGKVLRVLPEDNRLVVEGVAMVKRHVKAQGQQAGSIVEKEAAIDVSNVALWNATEGRRVKVGYKVQEDGTKVRVDRKTGATV
ncbi:MAG: 50S ribosomal protein L24 [Pseudomonadota bacterium]|nr:50S ribosomal protein L24 [Pseudomonadota bacterium]MDP2307161.1 50S ribosomal protein L24 [Pseudomonadota bacterium]